ncbi:hypothetical protein HYH02_012498 [Chlamydomonas schloesseri]|uniref:Uncharacterized protein n=1 Tax=Chlamydomonas schloesseri TaxID=2026947 RepID=A0A835T175_9CHLO|nr:hypothetical protein HYH02_012498 [Chlamydomonas schloesseri]|eukprot:KAG2433953.1 hypothetical protein HYH02_012498 [Chlamydomonas schloesseri]
MATAQKLAPRAGWWQQLKQTPAVLRGWVLPRTRGDRASYEHHALETPQRAWNYGPLGFSAYKLTDKALSDAHKLAALNVGVHHASGSVSVREHNKRKACA